MREITDSHALRTERSYLWARNNHLRVSLARSQSSSAEQTRLVAAFSSYITHVGSTIPSNDRRPGKNAWFLNSISKSNSSSVVAAGQRRRHLTLAVRARTLERLADSLLRIGLGPCACSPECYTGPDSKRAALSRLLGSMDCNGLPRLQFEKITYFKHGCV